jgi:cobalt-zinc-cadmium efflux system outer membrane protein
MKHLKYITSCALFLVSVAVTPQASLDSLMMRVISHNRTLGTASQYFETVQTGSKRNLYLENPEVGFAYLWGSPEELGNRTDLLVTQSFAFPTVYTNRSKLSNAEIDKASNMLASIKIEKLLEAKQLWIEKVYLNKELSVLSERMAELEQISSFYQIQYDNGEIGKLSLNKSLLVRATLTAERYEILAESEIIKSKINHITGNNPVEITDSMYYQISLELPDSVIKESLKDPLYQAYLSEVDRLNLQKKLTRATGMPKIRTGYYSEKMNDLSLRGFQLGITIPLWENANKIKHATGEILTAEMEADKFRSAEVARIVQFYTRFMTYLKQVEQLSEVLEVANDPGLLSLAVQTGEISMIEYFYEVELYYRVRHDFLLAEKELHLVEAELNKYGLKGVTPPPDGG